MPTDSEPNDDFLDAFTEQARPLLDEKNQRVWNTFWQDVGENVFLDGAGNHKTATERSQEYFQDHGLELVKDLTDNDIVEMHQALKENWGIGADEFVRVMRESSRAGDVQLERIYRTETHNAALHGHRSAALEHGQKTRSWTAIGDERQCPECAQLEAENQNVPVDEPYTNGLYVANAHPDCRCIDHYDVEDIEKYGTSEGVRRAWDVRGRGTHEKPREHSIDFDKSPITDKYIKAYQDDINIFDKHTDNAFVEYAHEIGSDGLPTIVSKEDIDNDVKNGSVELWRGTTTLFAQDFASGKMFVGLGLHGSGIYTAYGKQGKSLATYYAKTCAETKRARTPFVMRMTLDKSTRIANIKDIEDDMEANIKRIAEHGVKKRDHRTYMARLSLLYDPGRWALIHGYDAIDIPELSFMVILNRTKVRLQGVDL